MSGIIISRVNDFLGRPIRKYNNNPILDKRTYGVIFSDEVSKQYSTNAIVLIIDHKKDKSVFSKVHNNKREITK